MCRWIWLHRWLVRIWRMSWPSPTLLPWLRRLPMLILIPILPLLISVRIRICMWIITKIVWRKFRSHTCTYLGPISSCSDNIQVFCFRLSPINITLNLGIEGHFFVIWSSTQIAHLLVSFKLRGHLLGGCLSLHLGQKIHSDSCFFISFC